MKKGLILLMTAIMTMSVFSACGAKENNQEQDVVATATPEATDTNEADATPVPAEDDETVTTTPQPVRVALKDINTEEYVTLGDYKNIEVVVASAEVAPETVEELCAQIYNEHVTAEHGGVLDRAVANGDWVNIDYSGKKDGVAFEGGTAAAQQLEIGSGSFIAGFEEGLVGVMPGETVDLNLTFPEEYHSAELAGQAVVFTVTVNFIYPTSDNWSDDILACDDHAEFSTVEEMRQYIRDYLEDYYAYYYEVDVENAVVEAFMNQCEFKGVPEDLLQSYKDDYALTINNEAAMYGMDADTLCYYYYGVDLATFLDTYVIDSVEQNLAFQAVANAEGMNLNDEDFENRLLELAVAAGCSTVEEYIGANPKEGYREMLMLEDVVSFLVENATVKQPE